LRFAEGNQRGGWRGVAGSGWVDHADRVALFGGRTAESRSAENLGATEQFRSDNDNEHFYRAEMDSNLTNSLEAIANLIYLIRLTLHDPAVAINYVELAKERLKAIADGACLTSA
jgi:hypothetical protein